MRKKKCTMSIPEIIKMYESGSRTVEIAEQANVSARYINSVLQSNDVTRRPRGSWLRQYTINENYFKTWSNNMAYLLGFFVADGNMPHDLQLISFSQKDPFILDVIKKELNSNHPIVKNNKTGVSILNINSKIMKEDLMNIHGLTPNKSKDVKMPLVPVEYMNHFIRGYFDGDGNINYERRVVSFVGGSSKFMQQLKLILEKELFEPYLKSNGSHHRLFLTGRRTIYLFGKWIYLNKDIYLPRKYNEFQREKLSLKELKDRPIKISKIAVQERKNKFLVQLQNSQDIEEICKILLIKPQTFFQWLKKDTDFYNKVNKLTNN
jgi:LAGLIDADG-like domain